MTAKSKILLWRPVGSLVKKGHLRSIRIPFSLFYINELIGSTHHTVIYDEMLESESNKNFEPFDLIIAQINTVDRSYFFNIVSKLNLTHTHLICIGQDPTAAPEFYADHSFYRGECELVLAQNILSGRFKAQDKFLHIVKNLSELPILKYSPDLLHKYNLFFPVPTQSQKPPLWGQLLVNRGCPHYCSFCTQAIRESYGHTVRLTSVEHALEQISELLRAGATFLYFSDDDLTSHRDFLIELLKEVLLRQLKFKWTAHARVDEVDEDLLKLMKQSGCVLLRFGVESGSEKIIKILNKTTKPQLWTDQARVAFQLCHRLSIPSVGLFIIGNPKESFFDVLKTILLCTRLSPAIIQVHYFTAYPDSYYFKKINKKSIATAAMSSYHYSPPVYKISQIPVFFMPALRLLFYLIFIFRFDFFKQQIKYFFKFYINNKKTLVLLIRSLL